MADKYLIGRFTHVPVDWADKGLGVKKMLLQITPVRTANSVIRFPISKAFTVDREAENVDTFTIEP